jgi:hypothetical protein
VADANCSDAASRTIRRSVGPSRHGRRPIRESVWMNRAMRPFCSVTIRRASSIWRAVVLRRSWCVIISVSPMRLLAAFAYFNDIFSLGSRQSQHRHDDDEERTLSRGNANIYMGARGAHRVQHVRPFPLEAFGEPSVDRRKKLTSLIPLALIGVPTGMPSKASKTASAGFLSGRTSV